MTIYNKRIYRKIWEKVNGPIPKEPNGRSYDIHHIDGCHENNNIDNLMCITRQEHYDIHYAQGDFKACQLLAIRLKYTPEKLSEIASLAAKKAIKEGRHPFQRKSYANPFAKRKDGSSIASDRVKLGLNSKNTHPQFNHTVYTFKHKQSNQIIQTTYYDFRTKMEINAGNLSQLILGRRKSVDGWILLP